jgi:tetratricopeptide (TPR) repeat protein
MMRRNTPAVLTVIVIAVVATSKTAAIYMRADAQKVPVERLIANLERKAAEQPSNAMHQINLGRLHGMAYALKTEEVPAVVRPDSKEEEVWYGYEPKLVPYPNRPAASPEAEASAKAHLAKALAHYEKALQLDPESLLGRLGYGWMVEQSGDKKKAIEQYRRVIDQAWKTEQQKKVRLPGQNFFTREATDYLIPLLDPAADAAEIKELKQRQEALERLPRAITPIAIPLRDGIAPHAIHDPAARVIFDADGSGSKRAWSWIGPDAGWLVYDADGTAAITSALQLFGSVSFWLFWENGYDALSALDDNADGEVSGAETRNLAIWADRNRNGISERHEVAPLTAHGIAGLSCEFQTGDGVRFAAISPEGVRLDDGRTRPSYDVILRSSGRLTLAIPPGGHDVVLDDRARQHEQHEERVGNPRLNPRQ